MCDSIFPILQAEQAFTHNLICNHFVKLVSAFNKHSPNFVCTNWAGASIFSFNVESTKFVNFHVKWLDENSMLHHFCSLHFGFLLLLQQCWWSILIGSFCHRKVNARQKTKIVASVLYESLTMLIKV